MIGIQIASMAKTKGKAKVAASNAPSKVEASGNDNFVESVPSESVETEEAATTMILDKSEVAAKKEETNDGSDSEEVEELEEIEDGLDEPEEVDGAEKNEDGLDESEEVDETEESKDGLDASEEADKIEETKDATGKNDEGNKEEKTKEDGKVEPVGTDGPESEKAEERVVTGEVKDNGKAENASDKKAKRIRKRKKKGAASSNDANKSSEFNKQKTKEDGKVEPVGTDGPESEKVEERDMTGGIQDNGKGENVPDKKAKRTRRRKKKGAATAAASNDANKSSEADKQGTSAAAKDLKMADGMGLIFMCNAKTKEDCFHYKVFGLPAGKKELVAKVYKGMRLFLFDIDLKLMYGIYKAVSPGGYNIEPEAFKSAFPSQVRFTVLKDCLPLPEEKFKSAIKENYYGRSKFNCQLSPEQVKNLCKLFQSAGQTSKKGSGEVIRAEREPNSSSRGRKRTRHEGAFRAKQERSSPSSDRKRFRRGREVIRAEQERISSSRGRKRSRHERARHDDSIPRGRDLYARREAHASQPPRLLAPPPPLPSLPYAYVQPVDDYYYRRDPPLLDPRDHRAVHREMRTYEPLEYHDPYSLYREPLSREAVYREPLSREALYQEPLPREAVYREPLPREPVPYDPPATYYRY